MLSASRPKSIAIVVGITLTKRVINHTFTFFPNNPSIMAWPASVPTTDDAIPDDKRVHVLKDLQIILYGDMLARSITIH